MPRLGAFWACLALWRETSSCWWVGRGKTPAELPLVCGAAGSQSSRQRRNRLGLPRRRSDKYSAASVADGRDCRTWRQSGLLRLVLSQFGAETYSSAQQSVPNSEVIRLQTATTPITTVQNCDNLGARSDDHVTWSPSLPVNAAVCGFAEKMIYLIFKGTAVTPCAQDCGARARRFAMAVDCGAVGWVNRQLQQEFR